MHFTKYARLLWGFFRASFSADLEYRINFVVRIVTDIFWYAAQILVFEILFTQTEVLGEWTLEETRVFLGILFVVDGFYMLFFSENLDRFSDKVRKGDLDLLLAKPVNSQFMMSCQKLATAYLGNISMGVAWLCWSLYRLQGQINLMNILWLFALIPTGLLIVYANRFFFSATALIFTRADNFQYLWFQFYKLGTRPDSIYPTWLRYIILSVLPVGLVASVPARMVIEPPNLFLIAWTFCVGAVALWTTNRFWRYALTKYTSASS